MSRSVKLVFVEVKVTDVTLMRNNVAIKRHAMGLPTCEEDFRRTEASIKEFAKLCGAARAHATSRVTHHASRRVMRHAAFVIRTPRAGCARCVHACAPALHAFRPVHRPRCASARAVPPHALSPPLPFLLLRSPCGAPSPPSPPPYPPSFPPPFPTPLPSAPTPPKNKKQISRRLSAARHAPDAASRRAQLRDAAAGRQRGGHEVRISRRHYFFFIRAVFQK